MGRKTKGYPRVWYTHCCREDLPIHRIHPKTRFIIVVRDPRAAILSQYHFYRNHPLLGANEDLSLERLSDHFVAGSLCPERPELLEGRRRTGRTRGMLQEFVRRRATSFSCLVPIQEPH